MLRSLIAGAIAVSSLSAAVLPELLGTNHLVSSAPVNVTADRKVWDEYGFVAAERAAYGPFQVSAYRFKDTTGAFAAAQWLAGSDPTATTAGNYVLTCSGTCPASQKLGAMFLAGNPPNLSRASYPTLDKYMPQNGVVPRSKRYVLGPDSLALFEPRIPASTAAFEFSTEAQVARYKTAGGEEIMALFSYPTPAIARQQTPKFEQLTGAVVKRTAALVAVTLPLNGQTLDAVAAQKRLSQLGYSGAVSANETPPLEIAPETAGKMLVAIIDLAGLVLVLCVGSGLMVAAGLLVARRFGYSGADGTLITLHLNRK